MTLFVQNTQVGVDMENLRLSVKEEYAKAACYIYIYVSLG